MALPVTWKIFNWLQTVTVMPATKAVLGKEETPARGGGVAGTPDAYGFEVPPDSQ